MELADAWTLRKRHGEKTLLSPQTGTLFSTSEVTGTAFSLALKLHK